MWNLEVNGKFVKSAYVLTSDVFVFSNMSKSSAPAKRICFLWKLLHDRIPTRNHLQCRRILGRDASMECVLCGSTIESLVHLFFDCDFAVRWLGVHLLSFPLSLPTVHFTHRTSSCAYQAIKYMQ